MRLTRSNASQAIGLAPLIDVVFILLLFFMLATNFDQRRSIDVIDSGVATSEQQAGQTTARLHIEPNGMRLNGQRVDESALPVTIRQLLPGPDSFLLVSADNAVRLQSVVTTLDRLNAAGISNVRLELAR